MAPKIQLAYFGEVRARGEICQLALSAGNIKYEFVEHSFATWPENKPKMRFGALPNLTVDGRPFCQGIACATYCAKIADIYPKDPLEGLAVDEIALTREDLLIPETQWFLCQDPAEREAKNKNLREELYPKFFSHFEQILKENQEKTKGKYAVGKKLTLADVILYEATTSCNKHNKDILDQYPLLTALRDTVAQSKGIKDFLAKKPAVQDM